MMRSCWTALAAAVVGSQAGGGDASVCATPRGGVVISAEHVAQFPTRAALGELERLCAAGDTTLYDEDPVQAVAREFPFVGARLVAVQSKHGVGEAVHEDESPDLWIASGDSLRLADGQLVPRTLGELRARYGRVFADDNANSEVDDFRGFGAHACPFPNIGFKLGFSGHGVIPDSTRITSLEMWVHVRGGEDRAGGAECSRTGR